MTRTLWLVVLAFLVAFTNAVAHAAVPLDSKTGTLNDDTSSNTPDGRKLLNNNNAEHAGNAASGAASEGWKSFSTGVSNWVNSAGGC